MSITRMIINAIAIGIVFSVLRQLDAATGKFVLVLGAMAVAIVVSAITASLEKEN
jgi:hypothetical protein